ncbi:MAG: glycosyltransferase family 4 protein [Nitrospiraceae bacterium]
MNPIRVLLVRNCRGIISITGGETYLLSLLKGFDPAVCRCVLACIVNPVLGETPWLRELQRTGFEYLTIPVRHAWHVGDVKAITSLIKEHDIDIVHALDHRSDLVSLIAGRRTGRAVAASFLGWTNFPKGSWRAGLYPLIDRFILKRLDAVITDSVAIGKELRMGDDDTPVVAIRNGVDTEWFNPSRERPHFSRHDFTEGHFIFGMVGRIHPIKGHLHFLQAARTILSAYPDSRFVIAGTVAPGFETYQQTLLDFIRQHDMERAVLMTHVPLAEIPALFAAINVLVAPSFAESFSFTLLEGMAMGKVVVSSDVGGAGEMISDGETGYLIPVDDVARLIDVLLMLRKQPHLLKAVGLRARQRILKDLGIEAMAAKTQDVYRQLMVFQSREGNIPNRRKELRRHLDMISAK